MHKCFCGGKTEESICLLSPSTGKFLEPVLINVYDMHWSNEYTTKIGFGIYHTGIEIYGIEFAYAGHPFPFSGIFQMMPRNLDTLGDRYRYRQSIRIGHTAMSYNEVDELMHELGRRFRGDRYHLIRNNCNHFTGAVARDVCGKDMPHWVNRLAKMGSYVPYVEKILPAEWLTPVQPRPDYKPSNSTSNSKRNNVK